MSAPTLNDLAELPVWLAWQGEAAGKPGALPRKAAYASADCAKCASVTNSKNWGFPPRGSSKPNVRELGSRPVGRGVGP